MAFSLSLYSFFPFIPIYLLVKVPTLTKNKKEIGGMVGLDDDGDDDDGELARTDLDYCIDRIVSSSFFDQGVK